MALSRRMKIVFVVRSLLVAFALFGLATWVLYPAPDEVLLRDFQADRGTLDQVSAAARAGSVRSCADLGDPALRGACDDAGLGPIARDGGILLISAHRRSGLLGNVGYAWLDTPPEPGSLATRVSPRLEPSRQLAACAHVFRHVDGHWYLFTKTC